jgi:membrane protease YdiL (CAAX protease family)
MTQRRLPRDVVLLPVAAVLLGALLFGLWHVVVGGIVHGNPRAGTFGVVLSLVAGALLALTVVARRALRA